MKKTLLFFLVGLLTLTIFGCNIGSNNNGNNNGTSHTQKPSITLKEVPELTVGDEIELDVTLSLLKEKPTFTSSDEEILTVSEEGIIKALKQGTAIITVTIVEGEKTYEAKVEVTVVGAPHAHEFIDGVCSCGEVDPNYQPPIKDTTAPEFNKSANYAEIYELSWGKTFDPFIDLDVVDDVDGNINQTVKVVTDLNNEKYGEYTVTYNAEDAAGNKSSLERKVKVVWTYDVEFIGHAGSYYGVMNSEEAILYAIEKLQYQAVEVDIKQTSDGVFVLSHDDTFGDYTIASTPWSTLKDVEVTKSRNAGYPSQNGSVTGSPYTTKLCTLERFLDICKEYNVKPVIELKSSKGITNSDQSRMQALMDIIEAKDMLDKAILLGSSYNCLIWARNNGYTEIECQYLVNSCESDTVLDRCKQYNFAVSINVTGDYTNSDEWIFKYQEAGIKISTYTFTQYVNYDVVQKWINLGVDYVTCDWHLMSELNLEPTPLERLTVVFKDYDGTILQESVVSKGGSVTAPANPSRQGYKFTGWDKAFDNVQSNLEITALYEAIPNSIVYVYEDGSPEEFPCESVADMAEVFWSELYAWSGSSKDYETFKADALAKWKSGAVYSEAKVWAQGEKGKEIEGYFVSCKANYDRWMPWMDEFDRQVTNINSTQSAWGSTYVGYLRLYALLQQSASYWNATRNEAMYSCITKRAVLPTTYVSGTDVEIPNLFVTDGRTFLGWYDENDNLVTKVGANHTGTVTLTAKWSESIPAESFEITKPDRIVKFDSYQLVWSFTPANTTNQKLKFATSDSSILSVNEDGVITTYKEGKATITVTVLGDETLNVSWEVEVYYDPFIDGNYETSSVVEAGSLINLEATLHGMTDALVWESLNPTIATVNNGVVTGVAEGYAEIKVSAQSDANVYFIFGVTVSSEENADFFSIIDDAHNSDVHVKRNLMVAYEYPHDIFVSASDLLFNYDYYVNEEFVAKQAANTSNCGGALGTVEFITVHYTAGTPKSSNAWATMSYMSGTSGSNAVSIHYTTGNDGIYAGVSHDKRAWHAGDGSATFSWTATGVTATENVKPVWGVVANSASSTGYYFTLNGKATTIPVPMTGTTSSGATKTLSDPGSKFTYFGPAWKVVNGEYYMGTTWVCFTQVAEGRISSRGGNNNSIGIETACNRESDLWLTYQITAQLCARLMEQYSLDLSRVVGHNMFSGKDCPQTLLNNNGELWEIFMEAVEAENKVYTQMGDYTITSKSNNPEYLSDNGRIIAVPRTSTTVSYTVTVKNNTTGVTKTQTYSTIIHGEYTE